MEADDLELLTDILNRDHLLNSWEADFIEEMSTHIYLQEDLTPRQKEKFDEIWTKVTDKEPTLGR